MAYQSRFDQAVDDASYIGGVTPLADANPMCFAL